MLPPGGAGAVGVGVRGAGVGLDAPATWGPVLRTPRLVMRPLEEADASAARAFFAAGLAEDFRYLPFPPELEGLRGEPAERVAAALFERNLARTREVWADGTGVRLAAFLAADAAASRPVRGAFNRPGDGGEPGALAMQAAPAALVAMASLNNLVRGCLRSADAGWRTHAAHRGRGYASEAVGALLSLAFAPAPAGLGLHRVGACVMPENAASLRVAEKCGFRREGVLARYLLVDGAWRDHVVFGRTAEEHGAAGA